MAYIGTSPSNGVRRVHTYTATANQTTFTGSSTEGVTLTYADTNYIDVFQNGVLLGSADYTSTSGTSVVLAQGASVSDLVVIVVYDVFSVADTVSKTSGGSFDSAVTMSNNLTVSGAFTSQGIDDNADATAITIDSSERVGIGMTSPTAKLSLPAQASGDSGVARLAIESAVDSNDFTIAQYEDSNGTYTQIGQNVSLNSGGSTTVLDSGHKTASILFDGRNNGALLFQTGGDNASAERVRISSVGDLSVGHTGGLGPIRISAISTVADYAMYLRSDHATTPYGIAIKFLTEQNDTGSSFLDCFDGSAARFKVTPNGGLANYQANDSNLSDELEKNQFGQLDSTSDCVRSWEIVKYLYKDEDQTNPHKYGVIAQQIEEHCPELITNWVKVKASDEVLWSEEDEDIPEGVSVGDVKAEAVEQVDRMAVKEQQMFWMLVKSHQEALDTITALEARITALENGE